MAQPVQCSYGMDATFTKLRNGSWGIRVTGGTVSEGESVTVTKKSGEQSIAVVDRVLWSDASSALCAIVQTRPAGRSGPFNRRRNRYDGRTAYERGDRSPGAVASHYDRSGVYSSDGQRIGRLSCGHEDYPCCGC